MHWFNSHHDARPLSHRIADQVTTWTGSFTAFVMSVCVVLLWGMLGPYFDYSDTWQLVINTSTTIVTFLMVFLIQNNQNRQTERDRHQAEADYQTNLSAKQEIEDLQRDLARIEMEKLDQIIRRLDQMGASKQTKGHVAQR